MKDTNIIDELRLRLLQPLPGSKAHDRMLARVQPLPAVIPDNARPSAVLILLFPHEGELYVLLIKRTEDGRAHSGQISFPGGRQDQIDADLKATALREAQEEVGLMSSDVDILGQLTPLYIPVSNFQVYPFVAYASRKPQYNLSISEVAHIIEVPLNDLLASHKKIIATVTSPVDPGFIRQVNAYKLEDESIVWGATAMILSELEFIISDLQ